MVVRGFDAPRDEDPAPTKDLAPTENPAPTERLVGTSASMKAVLEDVGRVGSTDATVLIQGESGTGKELVAAAIHNRSPRYRGPWVPVNCGAIPESLVDSELFGHERGAFTDAKRRRRGRFELAHCGTLFLDEVGELTPSAQVRLLRALDGRPVDSVGGESPLNLDVRFIAATNQDLEQCVRAGTFRDDLFWRLNVFTIALPPLRHRTEDIPVLADHLLAEAAKRHHLPAHGIGPEALAALMAHPWPGNVRELRSVLESALIASGGRLITLGDLPPRIREGRGPAVNGAESPSRNGNGTDNTGFGLNEAVQRAQQAVEQRMIRDALAATGGNRTLAAKRLRIARKTLFNKLRQLGLDP